MVAPEFDADTDVQCVAPGTYRVRLTDRWSIGPTPNGGYLLAAVLKALGDALPHPDVLSITAHYLRPPRPDEARIDLEQIRSSRSLSTAQARLSQDGVERLRALATFTDLSGTNRPQQVAGGPPALPPPEECLPGDGRMPRDDVRVAIAERFDLRLHPDTVGWAQDGDARQRLDAAARERREAGVLAEVGGWIRLADGREPDLPLMAVVVDAFPPTAFDLGASGWIPTVELTLHGRARPAPGWLRCWITSRFLTGGWIEEDAQVWDSTDRLVAMSRQLARVPRLA